MRGNSRHGAVRAAQPAGTARAGASADAQRLAGLLEPAVTALGMDLEGVRVTSAAGAGCCAWSWTPTAG